MGTDDRQHMKLLLAARLSTKTTTEGLGIETQDQRGREWAEREGHTIVATAADYKSGRVAPWDRPNLKPWVTRPDRMQQYDGILAYRNDRLSRGSWDDETRIRQWASEKGKVLVIVDGPQWPPRDDGDFWSWTAQAKQAQAEWEEIRERSMRAQHELRGRGKLVGRPPFGYKSVGTKYNKRMVPTDIGHKYVPQIFQRIADGQSLAQVAAWLDSEGVKPNSKTGQAWSATSIPRMIRNRTYVGQRQDGDGRILLRVEPLVDAALWTQAGNRLTNAPRGRRGAVSGKSALLTGILFCQRCHIRGIESPMYKIRPPRDTEYYRCYGVQPQRKGCGNMVGLGLTDAAVTALLSMAHEPWKSQRLVPGENHDIELADIRLALDDLPKRNLPDADEDAERARLRAERDRLEALPNIPDDWQEVEICDTCGGSQYLDTCEAAGHHKVTIGEHFRRLDYEGQRALLVENVKLYVEPVSPPVQPGFKHVPMIRLESRLFKMPVEWIGPSEPVAYLT